MKDKELEPFYVNEHGKLVFGDLLCHTHYDLAPVKLFHVLEYGKYRILQSPNVHPSETLQGQVNRWTSSSSLRRRDLLNPYEAIIFCHARYINGEISWTQIYNRHQLQPPQYQFLNRRPDSDHSLPYQSTLYAPGSILTDPPSPLVPSILVARVQPGSHEWKCNVSLTALGKEVVDLSFDKFVVYFTNFECC